MGIFEAFVDEYEDEDTDEDEAYGVVIPNIPAQQALTGSGLAAPGSWTQRNVLLAGAQSAYARRLAGQPMSNADFAVIAASRPTWAGGTGGYVSPAWTGAPWQMGGPGSGDRAFSVDMESISSKIASDVLGEGGWDFSSEDFGVSPAVIWNPAKKTFRAARKVLRERGVSFQGYYDRETGAYIIGAPAPMIGEVRSIVGNAAWEVGADQVELEESRSSPGAIGEGWHIKIWSVKRA